MEKKHDEPHNPEFVREELCQARMKIFIEKIEGLRTEMKLLLGSSILTIVLIILQFVRELT